MGKTKTSVRRGKTAAPLPGRQAPRDAWTADELSAALAAGTIEEKVAFLRTAGILDERGELAKMYRSWGRKVSRTPEGGGSG
jgi:hypothetical protein